jgi:hypothetical protein
VNGSLSVTGTKQFRIDHPLDPANKYLNHSCVESDEMANLYSGIAMTDEEGFATVELPEWFEALNRDFRYQLTVLDESDSDSFIMAKVASKIRGNQFMIRTSAPNAEVSWQVTGIRRDPFADEHRMQVEEDKPARERGKYLHPELYDQPPEQGISHAAAQIADEAVRNSGPAESDAE